MKLPIMPPALLAISLALALSACGSDGSDAGNAQQEPSVSMNTSTMPVQEPPAPQNASQVEPTTFATPRSVQQIPADFRGRWGMVPDDCTSTRGDNKGLLTIDDNTLRFYESRATASAMALNSPTSLDAALVFTGEGQQWKRQTTLSLMQDGRTLVRSEQESEQEPSSTTQYFRCP